MKHVINGELFISGEEAFWEFAATSKNLKEWRNEGMPYIERQPAERRNGQRYEARYLYPLERCRAWFRGEL